MVGNLYRGSSREEILREDVSIVVCTDYDMT